MRYVSTRGQAPSVTFEEALTTGLAPDAGLWVPEEIPQLPDQWVSWDYRGAMKGVLGLFGAGNSDPIVESAASRFRHPDIAPLVRVGDKLVFELFWGPTLSFKDHAMQVVAGLLESSVVPKAVVLGATSGDTGSAAIEAFRSHAGIGVVVLFPEGLVTEFQRRQMTTSTADNVRAVAVRGTFDDCQKMVKAALSRDSNLLVANSINWGRIAAQVGYYVYLGASLGERFDVAVPTGNFGNVLACWVAKQMGVEIDTITIANNENHALVDLVNGRAPAGSAVHATVAPAMDVTMPSNLERFPGVLAAEFRAAWSSDEEIVTTIRETYQAHGYLLDPHTATAWAASRHHNTRPPQVIISTAHPAKFASTVRRAIDRDPELPDGFSDLGDLKERFETIDVDDSQLSAVISDLRS